MRATALLILVMLSACSKPDTSQHDARVEMLRAENATLRSLNDSLRKSMDRIEVEFDRAVNRKCDPSPSSAPAPKTKRIRTGFA